MYGHLPGVRQCNYRVEVYALWMLTCTLTKSQAQCVEITAVTDCFGVSKTWNGGKSPHFMDGAADLWRNNVGANKDLEKAGVKVKFVWVRSHLTAHDVEGGKFYYA